MIVSMTDPAHRKKGLSLPELEAAALNEEDKLPRNSGLWKDPMENKEPLRLRVRARQNYTEGCMSRQSIPDTCGVYVFEEEIL